MPTLDDVFQTPAASKPATLDDVFPESVAPKGPTLDDVFLDPSAPTLADLPAGMEGRLRKAWDVANQTLKSPAFRVASDVAQEKEVAALLPRVRNNPAFAPPDMEAINKLGVLPTAGEQVADAARAFPRTLIQTSADVARGLEVGARAVEKMLPDWMNWGFQLGPDGFKLRQGPSPDLKDSSLYQKATELKGGAEEAYPADPRLVESPLTQVSAGLASTLPMMGPAMVVGRGARVLGGVKAAESAIQKTVGTVGATMGAAQGFDESMQTADKLDADAAKAYAQGNTHEWAKLKDAADRARANAFKTAGVYGAVGVSEVLPVATWASRLHKINPEMSRRFAVVAGDIFNETVEEAAQNLGQQALQNVVAAKLFDKDRELGNGLVESGFMGGVVGSLMAAITHAPGAIRARLNAKPADASGVFPSGAKLITDVEGQPTGIESANPPPAAEVAGAKPKPNTALDAAQPPETIGPESAVTPRPTQVTSPASSTAAAPPAPPAPDMVSTILSGGIRRNRAPEAPPAPAAPVVKPYTGGGESSSGFLDWLEHTAPNGIRAAAGSEADHENDIDSLLANAPAGMKKRLAKLLQPADPAKAEPLDNIAEWARTAFSTAGEAHETGGAGFPTIVGPEDVLTVLHRELTTIKSGKKTAKREADMLDTAEAALVDFEQQALGRDHMPGYPVSTLREGSTFDLAGVPMTVTAINPATGAVSVKGGRYGEQVLVKDRTFYPDSPPAPASKTIGRPEPVNSPKPISTQSGAEPPTKAGAGVSTLSPSAAKPAAPALSLNAGEELPAKTPAAAATQSAATVVGKPSSTAPTPSLPAEPTAEEVRRGMLGVRIAAAAGGDADAKAWLADKWPKRLPPTVQARMDELTGKKSEVKSQKSEDSEQPSGEIEVADDGSIRVLTPPTTNASKETVFDLRKRMSADDITRILAGWKFSNITGVENSFAEAMREGGNLEGIDGLSLLAGAAGWDRNMPEFIPDPVTMGTMLRMAGFTHVKHEFGTVTLGEWLAGRIREAQSYGTSKPLVSEKPKVIDVTASITTAAALSADSITTKKPAKPAKKPKAGMLGTEAPPGGWKAGDKVPDKYRTAFKDGEKAFADGLTRVPRGNLTTEGKELWLKGWDTANLAAPEPPAPLLEIPVAKPPAEADITGKGQDEKPTNVIRQRPSKLEDGNDQGDAGLHGGGSDQGGLHPLRGGNGEVQGGNDRPHGTDAGPSGGTAGAPTGKDGADKGQGDKPDTLPGDAAGEAGVEKPTAPAVEPAAPETPPAAKAPANAGNFVIHDLDMLQAGGAKTKFKNNLEAIRTLHEIQLSGRTHATPEEQQKLALWVGWGQFPQAFDPYNDDWSKQHEELKALLSGEGEFEAARASTINAHYTDPRIYRALWDIAARLGYKRGRVLEAGVGSGVGFGVMPAEFKSSRLTGVEMDPITGAIARLLYPGANIQVKPFQQFQAPSGFFDLNIGNYPFADITILEDKAYKHLRPSLHNYFLLKSLDMVRPGGLVVVITSTGTMDNQNSRIREEAAKRGQLVAALRLPGGAFQKNAGTAVVTDILIFRRWGKDEQWNGGNWQELGELPDPAGGAAISINRYFQDNPQNILGTLNRESKMYRGGEMNVALTDDFAERLKAAIARMPADVMGKLEGSTLADTPTAEPERAAEGAKRGSLVAKDGKLFQVNRETGMLDPIKITAGKYAIVRAALKVRDTLAALKRAEVDGIEQTEIDDLRARLNQEYDAFKSAHGPFWTKENAKLISLDPDAPNLFALEHRHPKTGLTVKAAIFTKSTVRSRAKVEKAATASDAMGVTLNESGRMDLDRMAQLLGTSRADVETRLVGEGIAYLDPAAGWQPAAIYLSGNVRAKLLQAREAAAADSKFAKNVTELEKVQPADKDFEKIFFRLGAPWVPVSDYVAFACSLLNTTPKHIEIARNEETGDWHTEYTKRGLDFTKGNAQASTVWGTARADFLKLLENALNGKATKISKPDGHGGTVADHEATGDAAAKTAEIEAAFQEWLWKDDERRVRLHRFYNDNHNNTVETKWNGQHLTLPGKVEGQPVHPHIKNAIFRAMMTYGKGEGLGLFHEVGLGKTWCMAGIGVELKRTGLAKKPAIATLKSVLPGMIRDIRKLYPDIRILTTDRKFDAQKRKQTISEIATGDWDLVVLTHDNLNMLGLSPSIEMDHINRELQELEDALNAARAEAGKKDSKLVKQLEKRKARLEQKLKDAMNAVKDDNTFFDLTGIDMLMVDEWQIYKSLPIYTSGDSIKGIPTGDSDRATNMFARVRWLLENKGGVAFATATPISNTMAEMYILQKNLQPEALAAAGLQAFDAWKAMFGATVADVEPTVTGEIKLVARFKRFVNVQELRSMAQQVMDIIFADKAGVPVKRPKKHDLLNTTDMSEAQEDYIDSLQERAEDCKSRSVTPDEDNFLKISTDGRKMAIDIRMVDADGADDPESKLNQAVANVLAIHRADPKAVQLIFSDLGIEPTAWGFSAYRDIAAKLIKGGIPADKIVDYSDLTDKEREKSSARLDAGEALIAIGSSQKLGTGVNVQTYLKAIHHLDVPYTPEKVQQRDGRIYRHGNTYKEVEIHRYVTKGSFDAFMWTLVDNKATFINQFMRGDITGDEMEEENTDSLTYEQIRAIASGNPLLMDHIKLNNEVKLLEAAEKRHKATQIRLRSEAAAAESRIAFLKERLADLEEAVKVAAGTVKQDFSITLGGKVYDKRALADTALERYTGYSRKEGKAGTYRGFTVEANEKDLSKLSLVPPSGKQLFLDVEPSTASMDGILRNLPARVLSAQEELKTVEAAIKQLEERRGGEFPQAQELATKRAELARIEAELRGNGQQDPHAGQAPPPAAPDAPKLQAGDRAAELQKQAEKDFPGVPVKVVKSKDVPPDVANEAKRQQVQVPRAFWFKGQVWLVEDAMPERAGAVGESMRHEIAHALKQAIGPKAYAELMHSLRLSLPAAHVKWVRDHYNLDPAAEIEEVVSHVAESVDESSKGVLRDVWRRIVAAVRQWWRKIGARLGRVGWGVELSENDVRQWLRVAREGLQNSVETTRKGGSLNSDENGQRQTNFAAGGRQADGSNTRQAIAAVESDASTVGRIGSFSERIKRQAQSLADWAKQSGHLIPAARFDGFKRLREHTQEHDVFLDTETGRVMKSTRPGLYGLALDGEFLEMGTPAQYLHRIRLMDDTFETDVRLEGVKMDGDGQPTIVTSQKFIEAADKNNPHPTLEEVAAYMRRHGFEPLPYVAEGWINHKTGIVVADAHAGQFIKTADGLVPVDLIVSDSKSEVKFQAGNRIDSAPETESITSDGNASPIPGKETARVGKAVGDEGGQARLPDAPPAQGGSKLRPILDEKLGAAYMESKGRQSDRWRSGFYEASRAIVRWLGSYNNLAEFEAAHGNREPRVVFQDMQKFHATTGRYATENELNSIRRASSLETGERLARQWTGTPEAREAEQGNAAAFQVGLDAISETGIRFQAGQRFDDGSGQPVPDDVAQALHEANVTEDEARPEVGAAIGKEDVAAGALISKHITDQLTQGGELPTPGERAAGDFRKREDETRAAAIKRGLRTIGNIIRKSAVDTLKMAGGRLEHELLPAVNGYYDDHEAINGALSSRLFYAIQPVPVARRIQMRNDIENYWLVRECRKEPSPVTERLLEERGFGNKFAEDALAAMPEQTRAVLKVIEGIFEQTVRESKALGVRVKDTQTGQWRESKMDPVGYVPRVMDKEIAGVLREPNRNPSEHARLMAEMVEHVKATRFFKENQAHPEAKQTAEAFAADLLAHYTHPDNRNDFFGNLEMGRVGGLPPSWFTYRYNEMVPHYIASWAKRIAQIKNFGQGGDAKHPDLWKQMVEGPDAVKEINAQNYVLALERAIKEIRPRNSLAPLLTEARAWATVSKLTNPWTAIRNASQVINAGTAFGWGNTLPEMFDPKKLAANIKLAREAGVLRSDLVAGFFEESDFNERQSRAINMGLKAGGFTATEQWQRAVAIGAGLNFARKMLVEIKANPQSDSARLAKAKFAKYGVNWRTLAEEGLGGPEGGKWIRAAARETMFSYDLRQVPLWSDGQLARFMFQFQKFGLQEMRFVGREVIDPVIHGYKIEGKTVRDFRPLLFYIAALSAGAGLIWLRELLFKKGSPDATLTEIVNTAKDGKMAAAVEKGLWKLFHTVTYSGAFGLIGDWSENVLAFNERLRGKNPFQPPGASAILNLFSYLVKMKQQGGRLTLTDLHDWFQAEFPGYMYARAATVNAGGKFAQMIGEDWDEAVLQDAKLTESKIRRLGVRYADEAGFDRPPPRGAERVYTPRSPEYRALHEALLLGDLKAVQAIRDKMLTAAGGDYESKARMFSALRGTVAVAQPGRMGGLQPDDAREYRMDFRDWLKQREPGMVPELDKLQAAYKETAHAAGLMGDPREGALRDEAHEIKEGATKSARWDSAVAAVAKRRQRWTDEQAQTALVKAKTDKLFTGLPAAVESLKNKALSGAKDSAALRGFLSTDEGQAEARAIYQRSDLTRPEKFEKVKTLARAAYVSKVNRVGKKPLTVEEVTRALVK